MSVSNVALAGSWNVDFNIEPCLQTSKKRTGLVSEFGADFGHCVRGILVKVLEAKSRVHMGFGRVASFAYEVVLVRPLELIGFLVGLHI